MYWHIQYIFQMISADTNCFLSSEQAKSYSYLNISFTSREVDAVELCTHSPSHPRYLTLFLAGFSCEKWPSAQNFWMRIEPHDIEATWEAAQDRVDGDGIIFWLYNIRKSTKDEDKKKRQDILALKNPQHCQSSSKVFCILKSLKRGILKILFNAGYRGLRMKELVISERQMITNSVSWETEGFLSYSVVSVNHLIIIKFNMK